MTGSTSFAESAAREPLVVDGLAGIRALPIGEVLGTSDDLTITQEMIDAFADVTRDHQWIHVDVERAERESPFGGPVAHGYLSLSMIPYLLPQIVQFSGFRLTVNYGLDRVRFPSPVLAGQVIRAEAQIDEVSDVTGGVQVAVRITLSVPGAPKPACVVTNLIRNFT
ncbi:MaoC family dehydratase [Nocardioides marmoriginsengisoli]|uniref:MaoC family dehydratase n=1 Tax=Nocardioides marmoriginsengisoli TaxID=661483 RepID=A0A3N0CHJ8_9ACTN|nr:MaoC family dehydratase [Nocardioides marmoriginsengisoli]RNL62908.1 MaoC family dehydratase [Nocardioides marmoriginsengisoli]